MAWSLVDDAAWANMVTSGIPWQNHAIVRELWLAKCERAFAAASGPTSLSIIQLMTGGSWPWQTLQNAVTALAPSYVVSHSDSGVEFAPGYYGTLAYPTYMALPKYNAEKLFKVSGLWQSSSVYGWRHASTWPANWMDDNDPAFTLVHGSYSSLPRGILGPWMLYDIWRVINRLAWLEREIQWKVPDGFATSKWGSGGVDGWGILPRPSIDAAYNEAVGYWGDNTDYIDRYGFTTHYGGTDYGPTVFPPAAYFACIEELNNNPVLRGVEIGRWRSYATIAAAQVPNVPGGMIDWYAPITKAQRHTNKEWGTFGDPVVENTWNCVGIDTPLAQATTGVLFGHLDVIPNDPPNYVANGNNYWICKGWEVRGGKAAVRCNVPGGFTYQAV